MWDAVRDREIQRHGAAEHLSPTDQLFEAMYGHGTIEARTAAILDANDRALAAANADAHHREQSKIMSRALSNPDLHPVHNVDFEAWCKTCGLDQDWVRRNYKAVRACFEGGGDMRGLEPPRPRLVAHDRYAELGD